MKLKQNQHGVTLIELIIGLAILAILLALAMPSLSLFMQNSQNRGAAESILSGLQLARTEAVKRSTLVRFDLTDGTGKVAWKVGCVKVSADCPATIQSRSDSEGGKNARVGVSYDADPTAYGTAIAAGEGLAGGVSFNGLGRMPQSSIGEDITRIDITNAVNSSARRFVIRITSSGEIRMCDPALSRAANSQGCS